MLNSMLFTCSLVKYRLQTSGSNYKTKIQKTINIFVKFSIALLLLITRDLSHVYKRIYIHKLYYIFLLLLLIPSIFSA